MSISQIAILIFILVIVLVVAWASYQYYKFYKSEHLTCPKCGHEFKPPLLNMIFSPNYVDGKYIKCPSCNNREYCDASKDKN